MPTRTRRPERPPSLIPPVVILLFALFFPARAPAAPAVPPAAGDIVRAVRRLGDDDFAAREEATTFLWKAGAAAEGALHEALKSDDPEILTRAGELLERIRYGLLPDTPSDVAALLGRYRQGGTDVRMRVIQQLMGMSGRGDAALLRLALVEEQADLRRYLDAHLARVGPQVVPSLLVDGRFADAEKLLERGARAGGNAAVIRGYAAYLLVHGGLPDAVARWKSDPGGAPTARILAHLLRAQGDLAGARAAAEKAEDPALLEGMLTEAGDWEALSRLYETRFASAHTTESFGLRAICHRLAGHTKACEDLLAELRRLAPENPAEGAAVAAALILNDRPADGIATIRATGLQSNAFLLLCSRLRYDEAFPLANTARTKGGAELPWVELRRTRALQRLGRDAEGLELLRAGVKTAVEAGDWELAHAWLTAGRAHPGRDATVLEEAARTLPLLPDTSRRDRLLGGLFATDATEAGLWWDFLHGRFPDDAPAAALRRLGTVLHPRASDPGIPVLLREAGAAGGPGGRGEEARGPWLAAVAHACLAAGREDLAAPLLERLLPIEDGADAAMRLGDLFARRDRWAEAAERYGQAWEKDHRRADALYLQGHATAKTGREAEGRSRMDMARLIPLGDEAQRASLADALAARGLDAEAEREIETCLRTGELRSIPHDDAVRKGVLARASRGDFAAAAGLYPRLLLDGLRRETGFPDIDVCFDRTAERHRLQALACLAAGDRDGMLREADAALAARPADLELPIALVPALDARGRPKEADALFRNVLQPIESLCREHAASAVHHNQAAWLGARCRRDLDAALAHARKAVELDPGEASYLDTLAETHFQRGERERAVETMRTCIDLEPGDAYYRRQLVRFQNGSPDSRPE